MLLSVAFFVPVFTSLYLATSTQNNQSSSNDGVEEWLTEAELIYERAAQQQSLAEYAYDTRRNDETSAQHSEEMDNIFTSVKLQLVQDSRRFNAETIANVSVARRLRMLRNQAFLVSPNLERQRSELSQQLRSIYASAKFCKFETMANEPEKCSASENQMGLGDAEQVLQTSRNLTELTYVWREWRQSSGRLMRAKFEQLVQLDNIRSRSIGFTDIGDYMRGDYQRDMPEFVDALQQLWQEVQPLYEHLHAYVLRRLKHHYKDQMDSHSGTIPAHTLGNMWAQNWAKIYDILKPYPKAQSLDISAALVQQKYTPRKMFATAEAFFVSLGFPPLPASFWKRSIIEEPKDEPGRIMACHAAAWDFLTGQDVAIKMCTRIAMSDFFVIHHELGHIYYYLAYGKLPIMFRDGANPGFHEALGDTIFLSAATPTYFTRIGLLDDYKPSDEAEINTQMLIALDKLAFLPFGYLVDLWRWRVANGEIKPTSYNAAWWQLRRRYQGVHPPVERSEDDFDPGAKYHVAATVPYVRYYLAAFLQYQFHQSLCSASGYRGPLHRCSVYDSKEAGRLLQQTMSLGSSKPWPDALELLTQTRRPNASALLDYFSPLYVWLQEENRHYNTCFGWGEHWPHEHKLPQPRCARTSGATTLTAEVPISLCVLLTFITVH